MLKRIGLILLVLLSLPILLIIYNPSMQLGGFGMLLGMIGMTLSPLIFFAALIYMTIKLWK